MKDIQKLVAEAKARYDTMSPEQKAAHDNAQRDSFIRSITDWPKPKFKWVNGVKVYDSFADYCND
jgi:hypothetical protein